MMGRQTAGQAQFFYAFHLDEVVPADHVVRRIDAVLDVGWIHQELAPFYSNTRTPLDRPGTDDPNAAGGLRLCDPVGATDLCRGSGQFGVPLVLSSEFAKRFRQANQIDV